MKCGYLICITVLSLITPGGHSIFLDYPELREELEREGNYMASLPDAEKLPDDLKTGLDYQSLPTYFPEFDTEWRTPVKNEYPFAAFIYGRKAKPGKLSIGTACAAGIISYSFLITSCACLEFWYYNMSNWDKGQRVLNKDNFHAIVDEIYVTLANKEFVPDVKNDRMLKPQMPKCGTSELTQCAQMPAAEPGFGGIAVAQFEPSFEGEMIISSFVPWPPYFLPQITKLHACQPSKSFHTYGQRGTKVWYLTSGLITDPDTLYDALGRKTSTTSTLQAVRGDLIPFSECAKLFGGWLDEAFQANQMLCVRVTPETPRSKSRANKVSTIQEGLPGGLVVSRHGVHAVALETPVFFEIQYIVAFTINKRVQKLVVDCARNEGLNYVGVLHQGGDYPRDPEGLYDYEMFKPDFVFEAERPASLKPMTVGRSSSGTPTLELIALAATFLVLQAKLFYVKYSLGCLL